MSRKLPTKQFPREEARVTDPPRSPGSGAGPDREPAPGMPRWLKLAGITVIILILLGAVVMLIDGGGGEHGPARHVSTGSASGIAAQPFPLVRSLPVEA